MQAVRRPLAFLACAALVGIVGPFPSAARAGHENDALSWTSHDGRGLPTASGHCTRPGSCLTGFAAGTSLAPTSTPAARMTLRVLLSTRQRVPGTNIRFDSFAIPVINARGTVAVEGLWTDPRAAEHYAGLILASPWASSQLVVRQGQAIPGGDGTFAAPPADYTHAGAFPFLPRLDRSGGLYYVGDYATNANGYYADSSALFTRNAALARPGQAAPGGGTFVFDFDYDTPPVVAANGTLAFLGGICPCGLVPTDGGIVLAHPGGALTSVVRHGERVPEGDGTFAAQSAEDRFGFSPPGVNAQGMVAFTARKHVLRSSDPWSTGFADGLYLYAHGTLRKIVATDDPLPPPDTARFTSLYDVNLATMLDYRGEIAFAASTSDGRQGLYLSAAASGRVTTILRTGDRLGWGGTVCKLGNPSLADDGTVIFVATAAEGSTCYTGTDHLVMWRAGRLTEVVHVGQLAPGTSRAIQAIDTAAPAVNAYHRFVFTVTTSLGRELELFDGSTVWPVAGPGTLVAGRRVSVVDAADREAPGAIALNELGEVVFRAFFADGGVAVVLACPRGTCPSSPPPHPPVLATATATPVLQAPTPTATSSPAPPTATPSPVPPLAASTPTPSATTVACASSGDIAGTWQSRRTYDGKPAPEVLTLAQNGDTLAGTLTNGSQTQSIVGTVANGTVRFSTNGATIYDANTFTGTLSADGQTIAYVDGNIMVNFIRSQTTCA